MEEKRKFVRIDLCIEVTYEILPMFIGKGEGKNLSEGGLCFLTEKVLENNTALLLKFNLPDSENTHIECTGRVIWQKIGDTGYLTGIEFLKSGDFFKQLKIQRFVSDYFKDVEKYCDVEEKS